MFFLFGADRGRRQEIGSYGPYVCGCCGNYGRYHVYRTYSDVSLFFMPVVMWNMVYYAETTCCGSLYELDPKKGKQLLYWDEGEIRPQDLRLIRRGRAYM